MGTNDELTEADFGDSDSAASNEAPPDADGALEHEKKEPAHKLSELVDFREVWDDFMSKYSTVGDPPRIDRTFAPGR